MVLREETLQVGDAVCVTSQSQIARLIRFFQSGGNPLEYFRARNPSHVAPVIMYNGSLRLCDATVRGIIPSRFSKYNEDKKIKLIGVKRVLGIDELDKSSINRFLLDCIGTPYDFKGIGEFINFTKDNPKYYYCSEITEHGMNIGAEKSFCKFKLQKTSKVSPLDIWRGKTSVRVH